MVTGEKYEYAEKKGEVEVINSEKELFGEKTRGRKPRHQPIQNTKPRIYNPVRNCRNDVKGWCSHFNEKCELPEQKKCAKYEEKTKWSTYIYERSPIALLWDTKKNSNNKVKRLLRK